MNAILSSPLSIAERVALLRRHPPFLAMPPDDVARFAEAATERQVPDGDVVVQPQDGIAGHLLFVCHGVVAGRLVDGSGVLHDPGSLFPLHAVMQRRAVHATYRALGQMLALAVPAQMVFQLAQASPVFSRFLADRVQHFAQASRQALLEGAGAHALAEQGLEAPLRSLAEKRLVACQPDTPLREALAQMGQRHVGSVLVLDAAGAAAGILTSRDLPRLMLAQAGLDEPMARHMTQPVHTLSDELTLHDAALAMSRLGIRHLPVTRDGRVVNLVSEHDLFRLQRRTLAHVGAQLRRAQTRDDFVAAVAAIRELAGTLVVQGVSARHVTELVSHFNDLLTQRLVQQLAARHGLDMAGACWLAFGSEGRSEQTIATDQDNGLIYDPAVAPQAQWLAMAREVNEVLDACGFPLCKGGIMAGNPACCLTAQEWSARFAHWMEQGAPEDLLNASIYFDFRALAGGAEAAVAALREQVRSGAQRLPRFLKQMADNAMRTRVGLNWLGALDTHHEGAHAWLDLKLHGTAIMVEAARLQALAHGVVATSTRERIAQSAPGMKVGANEAQAWVTAFEFLQSLRLRVQMADPAAENPNRLDVNTLNDIDRRTLKEALRMARQMQQRMALDFARG